MNVIESRVWESITSKMLYFGSFCAAWPVTCHTKDLYHYNSRDTGAVSLLSGGAWWPNSQHRRVLFQSSNISSLKFLIEEEYYRASLSEEAQHTWDVFYLSPDWTPMIIVVSRVMGASVTAGEQWAVWPNCPVHALMPLMATFCPATGMPTPRKIPTNISLGPWSSMPAMLRRTVWLLMKIKVASPITDLMCE